MSERQHITFLIMLLTGNTQIWWNALELTHQEPRDWIFLKELIIRKFQTINETQLATEQINRIRQTTSVANYIAEFTALTEQIPLMGEDEQFRRFIYGLKTEIKNEMERREIEVEAGLLHLQEQAARFNNILFSQRSRPRTNEPFESSHRFDKTNLHQMDS